MENGASAEIAVVGNEGLVGVSLFMGSTIACFPKSWRHRAAIAPGR